jgi:GTP-binding protein LepA
MEQVKIRNFCIIAHIDHGKSTLADRLLEVTGTVAKRDMKKQLLDTMELEQEKGITIKLQPARMSWQDHQLNLIDTPGHVDFSYEVSRSLAAVEGAILVVDATQGMQAQTLSNIYMAIEAGLEIIPVVNKIDLPAADVARVSEDIVKVIGCKPTDIIAVSAKTGAGVEEVLSRVISDVPSPAGKPGGDLRALVFDSYYDEYRGVILYVRVVDGQLTKRTEISMMASQQIGEALEVGSFRPQEQPAEQLSTGEIGYVVSNYKAVAEARVGDTLTTKTNAAKQPLAGYQPIKPYVYAGFFPSTNEQHKLLKESLERLQLNDAALQFTPDNSAVLGFGFRIGFLGLLHLDIIKERLEREFGLELIITNPSTDYELTTTGNESVTIHAAAELPDQSKIVEIREPWINGEIVSPKPYLGAIVKLVNNARGLQKNLNYLDADTAVISFEAPLANVLTDFYDQLKSITSGYGSLNYQHSGYRAENLVRLDILVGGEPVDALSQIVHRSEAPARGREIVQKLQEIIPRQLFEVSLQAAIGGKIIAREDIKALGKNVTAKLYGGDITRKRKLWEKQKKGKQRMKSIGKVEIPPEAFMVMLKKD